MRLRKKGREGEHVWKGFGGEILESRASAHALCWEVAEEVGQVRREHQE